MIFMSYEWSVVCILYCVPCSFLFTKTRRYLSSCLFSWSNNVTCMHPISIYLHFAIVCFSPFCFNTHKLPIFMVISLLKANALRAKYLTKQAYQNTLYKKLTAVVCSPTSGIGQACAIRLAEQGYKVIAI